DDADEKWYEIFSYPIIDSDSGEVTGIVEFVRDITQHTRDEEQLTSQKERLANIIEGTDAGTWEWNVQTGETIFNERWAKFIGYSLEELSPTIIDTWMKHAHPDDLEKCKKELDRHFKGETKIYECEHRMKHKNGSWIWLLDRGKVVSWTEDGKPLWMFGTHQDITKRKQTEIKLQESESHFRLLIENAPDAIFIQTEGKFAYVNQQAQQLFGADKAEQLIGMPVLERFHPDYHEEVKKRIKGVNKRKKSQPNLEEIYLKLDRTHVDVEVSAVPFRYQGKDGALVFARDITERKNAERKLQKNYEELEAAEEELRASNEELLASNQLLEKQKTELTQYKRMVEGSEDMMAVVDKDYKYLCVNNAFLKYHQLNEEEVIGYRAGEVLGEQVFKEKLKPYLDKAIKGENVRFDMVKSYPEFGAVHLEVNYYPLENEEGTDGVVAVMRDITERKKAEEELLIKNRISNSFIQSEGKDFYKEVLDVIREAFSSEYGYFGYINDDGDLVSESMTRDVWDECQIEEKSIVFPKDSWAGVWGDSLKRRTTLYKNGNLQLPEGHVQLTSAMAAPIMANDQLIGQIALANKPWGYNNNDKKQINRLSGYIAPLLHSKLKEEQYKQELLEAKEKAEESDRLKSAFLANMSHEIRTPMNGIMGFSEMLQEKEFSKDKRDQFLNIIHNRTYHLLNIINDLVDVSKIEANQLALNHQNVCLDDVFKELHRFYTNQLKIEEKTHIQLKFNKSPDSQNSYIYSDPNRFRQIMDNLLNNAIKFTHEGSIEFGYEFTSDGQLLFYVRDTGIGISGDQQEHIFERFRQADDTTSRAYEGTGLGLTISKNLVELMGGQMWLDSTEGQGSVFYFTLPYESRQKTENNEIKEIEPDETEVEGKILLVIEDDPTSLEFMKALLEPGGFNLIACTTGKEGYEAFLNHPEIDLILMDIKLPDTTGLELTKKIRSSMDHSDVPIIAQTAYAMSEDVQKSIDAGCDDYISKPIDQKRLLAKIHKFI
ncbi:MAG: PAS domain S-box protein, partial [Bacteroidales bacterium]